ncbi:hypothetical protein BDV35DRAFT_325961 [Aspergillus flavus]|uniref:Secreted protein n=1 Tax=Aspergillus flavus TaxID=5059 RepID=A0A5N6GLS9_ASPFL|nr:hypothetical protein BDV35DRAFT_325961 [Aspergillus flavus]
MRYLPLHVCVLCCNSCLTAFSSIQMRFSRAPIPVPNSREESVDHCWIIFVITVVIQQLHNGLSDSVRGVDIPSRGSSNVCIVVPRTCIM